MILPSDYNTAQSFSSAPNNKQRLTLGGHICQIRTAYTRTTTTKNTRLCVEFDIKEGSEFDGYYFEQYERKKRYSDNPRWNGKFEVNLLNAQGGTNGYFKGFIQAVEESNPGYNFQQSGANEISLQGKFVGFNFGEEEYHNNAGDLVCIVTPRFAVSVARVREGVIPPAKKQRAPYGAYSAPQSASSQASAQNAFVQVEDDDLPF